MISFSIDGKQYQAEKGMTWAEWVANTSYNPDGYYLINGYVNNASGIGISRDGGIVINGIALIEDGHAYLHTDK